MISDAELVFLAVAQVLLRYDDERHCYGPRPRGWGTCSLGCFTKASNALNVAIWHNWTIDAPAERRQRSRKIDER